MVVGIMSDAIERAWEMSFSRFEIWRVSLLLSRKNKLVATWEAAAKLSYYNAHDRNAPSQTTITAKFMSSNLCMMLTVLEKMLCLPYQQVEYCHLYTAF